MAPRTDVTKELSDIKDSLQTITKEILEIKKSKIEDLNKVLSKISELEQVVQSKNAKLLEMEEKLNEFEQYSRKDNLIMERTYKSSS